MIFTVGELIEALETPGNDAPIFVSLDPRGGREAARQLEVAIEHWTDPETHDLIEAAVIYPM